MEMRRPDVLGLLKARPVPRVDKTSFCGLFGHLAMVALQGLSQAQPGARA